MDVREELSKKEIKMLREIEINNFRGFDHLEIEGLTKINVLVGTNNVGKTSALEAVFMIMGMAFPHVPTNINYWRAPYLINNINTARYLFHNVDFTHEPLIKAYSDQGTRRLTFSPRLNKDLPNTPNFSLSSSEIKEIFFSFDTKDSGEYMYQSRLFMQNGMMQQAIDPNYKEDVSALFIPADKNDQNANLQLSNLVKRNRKLVVVEALREFDPNIENIEVISDGLYISVKGAKELLPITMAGDGARRVVNIISSIATEDYDVVIIDEIDSGLHYSAHQTLWRAILKFVAQRDIQLFVTTHNLESIQSLNKELQEQIEMKSSTAVFNIAKTVKNGFQAYRYGADGLNEMIKNQIEIRQ